MRIINVGGALLVAALAVGCGLNKPPQPPTPPGAGTPVPTHTPPPLACAGCSIFAEPVADACRAALGCPTPTPAPTDCEWINAHVCTGSSGPGVEKGCLAEHGCCAWIDSASSCHWGPRPTPSVPAGSPTTSTATPEVSPSPAPTPGPAPAGTDVPTATASPTATGGDVGGPARPPTVAGVRGCLRPHDTDPSPDKNGQCGNTLYFLCPNCHQKSWPCDQDHAHWTCNSEPGQFVVDTKGGCHSNWGPCTLSSPGDTAQMCLAVCTSAAPGVGRAWDATCSSVGNSFIRVLSGDLKVTPQKGHNCYAPQFSGHGKYQVCLPASARACVDPRDYMGDDGPHSDGPYGEHGSCPHGEVPLTGKDVCGKVLSY